MLEGKCEENRVPKDIELTLQKKQKWARENKDNEKGTKRNDESKKKWKEREINTRIMKNDLSWNDPWSDHPEIQFEPIYLFFRNHEP